MRKTGIVMLTILMLAGCAGKTKDTSVIGYINYRKTPLNKVVDDYQAEQAYLSDASEYETLLLKIKKYDNGLSDDDYTGQEMCIHDRGYYEKDEIVVQLYSEPHIYHPYIVDITLKGESAKHERIYIDGNSYDDVVSLLESNGFVRQEFKK